MTERSPIGSAQEVLGQNGDPKKQLDTIHNILGKDADIINKLELRDQEKARKALARIKREYHEEQYNISSITARDIGEIWKILPDELKDHIQFRVDEAQRTPKTGAEMNETNRNAVLTKEYLTGTKEEVDAKLEKIKKFLGAASVAYDYHNFTPTKAIQTMDSSEVVQKIKAFQRANKQGEDGLISYRNEGNFDGIIKRGRE